MLNIRRSAWTLSEFDHNFERGSSSSSVSSVKSCTGSGELAADCHDSQATDKQLNQSTPTTTQLRVSDSSSNPNSQASRDEISHISGTRQQQQQLYTNNLDTVFINQQQQQQHDGCFKSNRLTFYDSSTSDKKSKWKSYHRKIDWRSMIRCPECLSRYIPILGWLPAYERKWFAGDLTAGLTVAIINISICLSSAVVAETDPGTAFRSSVINCFIYSLLCSSRHTSFGAWSIISQMLVISVKQALGDQLILNRLNLEPVANWSPEEYERLHLSLIVMYAFLIGMFQLLGGFFNLGNLLASFIPEALGSSMLAATAFIMSIGQLANMCGTSNKILWSIEKNTTALWADLENPPLDITDMFADLFRWAKQIALLVKYYEQINVVCVIISVTSVGLLFLNNGLLQRKLEDYLKKKMFIPFEVILVIVMSIVSDYMDLKGVYHVTTCGAINIDLPAPNMPNLKLIRELWFESLTTAIISYSMVNVMSKKYSNKFNYEVDYNQELIACGMGNLVGSLFEALPATGSFSRTMIKVEAGNQTQLASIINCATLLVLAHFFGHYVTLLPVCVTSSALFFGFIRMLSGFSQVFVYWRVCKVDFMVWVFTFVAILTMDLVNGFVYGLMFSLVTMLYRARSRRCYMLGSICSSDVYVPLVKYPVAQEIPGIKIFQFCGPVHYVNADIFERMLRNKTRINVSRIRAQLTTNQQQQQQPSPIESPKSTHNSTTTNNIPQLPSHIILDFSMISFVDTAGILVIKKIIEDYESIGITILVASLASHVAVMVKKDASLWGPYKERFYVTLADAVHCAIRANRKF